MYAALDMAAALYSSKVIGVVSIVGLTLGGTIVGCLTFAGVVISAPNGAPGNG